MQVFHKIYSLNINSIKKEHAMKFQKIYEKAVHNVLERLYIPPGNLNLPRRNMPQVLQKDFEHYLDWLKQEGVGIEETEVNGASLSPSQLDINEDKVRQLIIDNADNLNDPIIVSNDGYVIDGHHRFLAILNKSLNKHYVPINAYKMDLPIHELIKITMKYPRVKFRDVDNNFYDRPDKSVKDL